MEKLTELHKVIMSGQDVDEDTACWIVDDLRRMVEEEGCDPDDVLFDEGLEPDYVFDLIYY